METGLPQRWSPKHQGRVLLAEDDPEMRQLMAWALRKDGYQVEEVGDGDELLRSLGTVGTEEGARPDVIVSDIRMPGCTGLEVLERLRREHQTLPVVLVTAFGDRETHSHAERLGAQLLDKPFSLDDLRKTVFDVLELT